jgi:CheY-like chemotaxis protein
MPVMDGEKLYEHVCKDYPLLAKRMVFVTGDTVSPKTRTFLDATGNRWISKPFNIADVERLVGEMLHPDPLRELTDTTVDATATQRRYRPPHR